MMGVRLSTGVVAAAALTVGLAAGLAGCSLIGGKGGEPAAEQEMATGGGELAFVNSSTGLPTNKIWKSQIDFGDVNGDGNLDLAAVSRLADGAWVWLGDGKGGWTASGEGLPREPFCGGGVAFADINNDGHTDLAVADHCKGVYVFTGDGKGNWRSASSGLPTIGSEDVALGDFNNDGCADLVSVAAAEEGVRAFYGNCKGVWKETSDGLSITDWGNGVLLRDLNGDGNLDIAAAYAAGPRVWSGDGKGGWKETSVGLPAPDIHGLYWGIAAGDINGDGLIDIASGSQMPPLPNGCGAAGAPVCAGGGVEAYLQQKDGSWKFANEGLLPMNALGVALGDLDGDGNIDLVAVGKQALDKIGGVYGVYPYLGDGTGKWRLVENSGLPASGLMRTWGVALGDVDNDGHTDVAFALGDVVHPSWRSGDANSAPQRGKFGAIEVWRSTK